MHKLTVAVILLGGVASAAPASKPKLTFGTPTVKGPLDAKVVNSLVKRNAGKLLACYTKALAKTPDLQGTVTATFTIGSDGAVLETAANGLGEQVETCVAATITPIKFPKRKDDQTTEVTYPLVFSSGAPKGAVAQLGATGDVSSGLDDTNVNGGVVGNEPHVATGFGFGRSGLGPGASGPGWGTIGTGNYGSGTGSGYGIGGARGGMRGRTSAVPTLSIGQPSTTGGDLDKAIIRRYIKRNVQKLLYCYEKQLLAKPALQGTVTAQFTIATDGLVSASAASGVDKDVETCVADVIKTIEFPKPKGNGEVVVTYPMTFRPAGANPAPAPTPKK